MDLKEGQQVTFKLVGGRLSLDFTNTVDRHVPDDPDEKLRSYGDLLAWATQTGIATAGEARALREEADRRPEEAQAVFDRAVTLREALYRIFLALSEQSPPAPSDVSLLNSELSRAMSRTRITFSGGQFEWDRRYPDGALDRFLWNIVQDAADLMTSDELDRIGQCAGDNCEWLFLDMSKNRSRQWCTMEDCGNRAKARRFYNRKKRSRSSHENTPSGSS